MICFTKTCEEISLSLFRPALSTDFSMCTLLLAAAPGLHSLQQKRGMGLQKPIPLTVARPSRRESMRSGAVQSPPRTRRAGRFELQPYRLRPVDCNPYRAGLRQNGGQTAMTKKEIYVERRPEGDYAVRRPGSERASAVTPTQSEAIGRAREIAPRAAVHVERVKHTNRGRPDEWRNP